jgi:hypothetical protein
MTAGLRASSAANQGRTARAAMQRYRAERCSEKGAASSEVMACTHAAEDTCTTLGTLLEPCTSRQARGLYL